MCVCWKDFINFVFGVYTYLPTYLDSFHRHQDFFYSFQVFLSSVKETLANSINQSIQQARGKIRNKRREEKRREEDQNLNLTESKEWSPKCIYLMVTHSSTFVHLFYFHISLSTIKAHATYHTSLVPRTHVHH